MQPRIVHLDGRLPHGLPICGAGLRLSENCAVRTHDGRGVLFEVRDGYERPWCLLDHDHRFSIGGENFRFVHSDYEPAVVSSIFKDYKPCDPAALNHELQNHLLDLLCRTYDGRARAAVILDNGIDGFKPFVTFYPEPFTLRSDIIDTTRRGFLPGTYVPDNDVHSHIYCAKVSRDNQCLGVLYFERREAAHLRSVDRWDIVNIAHYLSIFFAALAPHRGPNPQMIAVSGPDSGKVLPLTTEPLKFGPAGFDDPEPIYSIESTEKGAVLRFIPGAMERRFGNVLDLIFEKIPATTKAAVCMLRDRKRGEFFTTHRPAQFEMDMDIFRRAFRDECGQASNEDGRICAASVFNRKHPDFGPGNRIGVLYIESSNGAEADPKQLSKLLDVSLFASKYLAVPSLDDLVLPPDP